MNKYVKYTIVFATLGVTGVVGLMLYKKYKKPKKGGNLKLLPNSNGINSNELPNKINTGNVNVSPSKDSNVSMTGKTPFTSAETGNFFRLYVNETYPSWAKENDLDKEGNYDNSYIRKAYAMYGKNYIEDILKDPSNALSWGGLISSNANKPDYVDTEFWRSLKGWSSGNFGLGNWFKS